MSNEKLNQITEHESKYPNNDHEWVKTLNYAVIKDGLYVSEDQDDIWFVIDVDEATQFPSYGLGVKKLAKYVDGTVVEILTKKTIRVLQEGGEE